MPKVFFCVKGIIFMRKMSSSHVAHLEQDCGPVVASCWSLAMEYDRDKVDEMVLALLWLTRTGDGRAWKGHDWDAMERLHGKGYISDPKSKAKSVVLSEEGERLSRELFQQHFARKQ
jgi:Zn-finger domain-containing protein